jgi:hypothetical protein
MNRAVIATWLLSGPSLTRKTRPAASERMSNSTTRAVEGRSSWTRLRPRKTPAKTPRVRASETLTAESASPSIATSGTSTAKSGRSVPSSVLSHQARVPAALIFAARRRSPRLGRGGRCASSDCMRPELSGDDRRRPPDAGSRDLGARRLGRGRSARCSLSARVRRRPGTAAREPARRRWSGFG